jgi:two-component system, chemotaxis family, chemotaxis protein CheY
MKILIADDSEFMRVLLKKIVQSAWPDAEINEAATGQQAIDSYGINRPDIILMDIMMPEKTGLEALKEIGSEVPVIIISAADQDNMIEEARSLGARDFIAKPFEQTKVIESIQAALGGAQASTDSHE